MMTIRELPKTKKMQVDEMHPMLKVQKNVLLLLLRNLRMTKSRR